MATLGDIVYNLKSFLSFDRTLPSPKAARRTINPVTSDPPPGGRYANWETWDQAKKARLAMQTSWFFSAVHRIGMAALLSHLLVKRRVGEDLEDIKNHPLELLLQSPNMDLSREYLWLHTIYSLYLKRAYWFLYPDQRGDIGEIWPMPFDRVTPVADLSPAPQRLFSGYIYTFKDGHEITLLPDNVVDLRFPNPLDIYGSLPPLQAAMKPVVLDNAQAGWNTNVFDGNKGLPSSIVGVDTNQLDSGQFDLLKQELKDNVGKRYLVPSGLIKVEFLQETHEEMQFLEGREFNQKEIFTVLGVPLDETNQDAWRWFINNTVWPVLTMLAGQITTQLIKPYFGPDILAEFEDIRPQDRSLNVQESVQFAPFRSFNEERATRGEPALKPVKIPEHIEGYAGLSLYDDVPSKLVDTLLPLILKGKPEPVPPQLEGFAGPPSLPGSAGAAHQQEQMDREAADTEDVEAETQVQEPEATAKAGKVVVGGEPLANWQDIALKKLGKGKSASHVYLDQAIPESRSYELAAVLGHCHTEAAIKAVFDHLDDYANLKAQLGKPITETPPAQLDEEDAFIDPVEQWLAEQSGRISRYGGEQPPQSFWDNEVVLMTAFLVPFVARWADSGINETINRISTTGLGVDALANARAANWANEHALELAKNLTDTTRELSKAKIKQWLATGSRDIATLEGSLAEIIAPRWRASLIAQTEVTRAWAEANRQIAKELNVVKKLVIITARDERVCPICGPLDGVEVGKSSNNLPPFHPRCRCLTGFVV